MRVRIQKHSAKGIEQQLRKSHSGRHVDLDKQCLLIEVRFKGILRTSRKARSQKYADTSVRYSTGAQPRKFA
jgi:hypothetical protein